MDKDSGSPTFLVDEMLGRLAKWLRILGYDTTYASGISDAELLDIAESEGRIILTRDTLLVRCKRCRRHIFVRSDHWREQLRQVYREAKLTCISLLSRCPVCNHPLDRVEKHTIKSMVPPYVFQTQDQFSRCGKCLRVYWSATHVAQICDELRSVGKEP